VSVAGRAGSRRYLYAVHLSAGTADNSVTPKEGSTMNVQAIDPNRAAITSLSAAATNAPAKKAGPAATPGNTHAVAPAAPSPTPAATAQMTQVPASVAADDRSTYLQILKANGGNVAAALAAIATIEAKENNG
jgi:hypothetical protein